jgi:hypothetical protein
MCSGIIHFSVLAYVFCYYSLLSSRRCVLRLFIFQSLPLCSAIIHFSVLAFVLCNYSLLSVRLCVLQLFTSQTSPLCSAIIHVSVLASVFCFYSLLGPRLCVLQLFTSQSSPMCSAIIHFSVLASVGLRLCVLMLSVCDGDSLHWSWMSELEGQSSTKQYVADVIVLITDSHSALHAQRTHVRSHWHISLHVL